MKWKFFIASHMLLRSTIDVQMIAERKFNNMLLWAASEDFTSLCITFREQISSLLDYETQKRNETDVYTKKEGWQSTSYVLTGSGYSGLHTLFGRDSFVLGNSQSLNIFWLKGKALHSCPLSSIVPIHWAIKNFIGLPIFTS